MKDSILIDELEVFFRIGVPDEERAGPQRLLITVEMEVDTASAAKSDDITKTVDYFQVSNRIKELGQGREWRLIETLAEDIAQLVLEYGLVDRAQVEVSKFILPDTRRVAVRIVRHR